MTPVVRDLDLVGKKLVGFGETRDADADADA